MLKNCNIYLKPERFRKSKFALSKVKSFQLYNVNFDLQKRSGLNNYYNF